MPTLDLNGKGVNVGAPPDTWTCQRIRIAIRDAAGQLSGAQ